eukprot:TRINITY_DN3677_c0_g3_i2.p1 TRINITY_DN3677_c0_g3~~TRINITY_DN3677_c0_g3_i2.p1  ORF type:complete len:880 (-),score=225.66 TRINITY_DN3677_c0_g3_i2:55-2694(-)
MSVASLKAPFDCTACTIYENRSPIGKQEVLSKCTADQLRNFYKKWYKPSLMMVAVVGAISPEDASLVVDVIKETFSYIPNEPPPYDFFKTPVDQCVTPKNDQPLIQINCSSEKLTSSSLVIIFRTPVDGKSLLSQISDIFMLILGCELNPRVLLTSLEETRLGNLVSLLCIELRCPHGSEMKFLEEMFFAFECTKKFINKESLESLKEKLTEYVSVLLNKSDIPVEGLMKEISDHFLLGEPTSLRKNDAVFEQISRVLTVLDPTLVANYVLKYERAIISLQLSSEHSDSTTITAELINKTLNEVKEKVAKMTEKDYLEILEAVNKGFGKVENLIEEKDLPPPGLIVHKEQTGTMMNVPVHIYTLSNQAQVHLLPFSICPVKNEDEREIFSVECLVTARGGKATLCHDSPDLLPNCTSSVLFAEIFGLCGLKNHQLSDWQQKYNIKLTDIQLDAFNRVINLHCFPHNFEHLLQMLHAFFTRRNTQWGCDPDDHHTARLLDTIIMASHDRIVKNETETAPEAFGAESRKKISRVHPALNHTIPDVDFDTLDYQTMSDIFEVFFGDVREFTFIFANTAGLELSESQLENLLKKYIGSIPFTPTTKSKTSSTSLFPSLSHKPNTGTPGLSALTLRRKYEEALQIPPTQLVPWKPGKQRGIVKRIVKREVCSTTWVEIAFPNNFTNVREDTTRMAADLLQIRLYNKMVEEKGQSYSPSTFSQPIDSQHYPFGWNVVVFTAEAPHVGGLVKVTIDEIKKLQSKPVSLEELKHVFLVNTSQPYSPNEQLHILSSFMKESTVLFRRFFPLLHFEVSLMYPENEDSVEEGEEVCGNVEELQESFGPVSGTSTTTSTPLLSNTSLVLLVGACVVVGVAAGLYLFPKKKN